MFTLEGKVPDGVESIVSLLEALDKVNMIVQSPFLRMVHAEETAA